MLHLKTGWSRPDDWVLWLNVIVELGSVVTQSARLAATAFYQGLPHHIRIVWCVIGGRVQSGSRRRIQTWMNFRSNYYWSSHTYTFTSQWHCLLKREEGGAHRTLWRNNYTSLSAEFAKLNDALFHLFAGTCGVPCVRYTFDCYNRWNIDLIRACFCSWTRAHYVAIFDKHNVTERIPLMINISNHL